LPDRPLEPTALLSYVSDDLNARRLQELLFTMPSSLLPDRGVISLSGPDAAGFLDNLLTVSVGALCEGQARFGALLTPQGKIIADGFIVAVEGGFFFDCPALLAKDLVKRLSLYKLRAKVDIADRIADHRVVAVWGDGNVPEHAAVVFDDPRFAALGKRAIVSSNQDADAFETTDAYQAHRIGLGIPQGGRDFLYSDAFPHEADMDFLHGIDFGKGCYVGQEVVSRMQHRGTARTRCVRVRFSSGSAPAEGTEAMAGDKLIGRIGSSTEDGYAMALLRLDRVEEAKANGEGLSADGLAFDVQLQEWMTRAEKNA
jgi:tRNA-modifying protein YgfZ